jgi:hypothetical protein
MKLYIIVFEISRITNFEQIRFIKLMDSFGDNIQLTINSYMLLSEFSPVEMRNQLRSIRNNARIFISEISSPAAWGNLICENSEVKDFFHY